MNDERITAYLLNELSESEAEQFEEECFAKLEWPEDEFEAAEEDLIQAYVKDELSAERRQRFEQYYLTTAAREDRVLIARSFVSFAQSDTTPPPKVTWRQRVAAFLKPGTGSWVVVPRFAAVVLVIGLTSISAWLALRPRAPQTFEDFELANTTDKRATSNQVLTIRRPSADALRFSLNLPEPAAAGTTYRVQLDDVKGRLEDLKIEKQDAKTISVIIPAKKLKGGQYALKLFQKTPDGTEHRVPGNYLFNVE